MARLSNVYLAPIQRENPEKIASFSLIIGQASYAQILNHVDAKPIQSVIRTGDTALMIAMIEKL